MINGTLCVLRKDEKILLLHRTKGGDDIHNGLYVPPGGRIERGERGLDCVIREIKEETNITFNNPKLRVIATFYNQGRILGGKKDPEDWHVELYESREVTGELIGEPNAKPMWIHESNLDKIRMHAGDREILKLLKQVGIFEVLTQYDGEELIRFEYTRVA